jgi:hypothetical protein
MRGSLKTIGRDPSPVSHLAMRAILSRKGRGNQERLAEELF